MSRSVVLALAVALLGCGSSPSEETTATTGSGGDPDANADGDCMTDAEELEAGTDPNAADSDADGLTDCDEIALGTQPTIADSDADGLTDSVEVTCVSDPLDGAEKCYACGWKHNDPGNLVSTGSAEGNVVGNIQLIDQCLETVSLWDFASTADSPSPEPAEYHILFMTASW